MMRRWHCACASKRSSGAILFVFWLSLIPWTCSAQTFGEDGTFPEAADDNGFGPRAASNSTTNSQPKSDEAFDIDLNILRWGKCQKIEGKPLRCCENDVDAAAAQRYYACEDIHPSDMANFIFAKFEVGDLRRTLMDRYMEDVSSFFNASENPAWAELSRTPIGELGDVPFSTLFSRPIRKFLSRAMNRSSQASDRLRLEEGFDEVGDAVNAALNHTLNEVLNDSLDYVFALDDSDFDFVTGQWFQLRERSLENILQGIFTANATTLDTFESVARIAWRLFVNQQQEAVQRILANPTVAISGILNQYLSNNRSRFSFDVVRSLAHYFATTENYQLTIPLCYTLLPMTSGCINIKFLINTNDWTLIKTVRLAVESNMLEADSFSFEILDMNINATGFRDRNHRGVCAHGKINVLDLEGYPFPQFQVNCHPIFYRPFSYLDQPLCLLYERTTRYPEPVNSLGKVCLEPIRDTLIHEVVRNMIRVAIGMNNLQPEANRPCRTLISQLHSGRSPGDTFFSRAVTETLIYAMSNVIGIRPDRRTVQSLAHFSRTAPLFLNAYSGIAQASNDSDQFSRNVMECGVLFLEHAEHHRLAAQRTVPVQVPTGPVPLANRPPYGRRNLMGNDWARQQYPAPSLNRFGVPVKQGPYKGSLERHDSGHAPHPPGPINRLVFPDRPNSSRVNAQSKDSARTSIPAGSLNRFPGPSRQDTSKGSVESKPARPVPAGSRFSIPDRLDVSKGSLEQDDSALPPVPAGSSNRFSIPDKLDVSRGSLERDDSSSEPAPAPSMTLFSVSGLDEGEDSSQEPVPAEALDRSSVTDRLDTPKGSLESHDAGRAPGPVVMAPESLIDYLVPEQPRGRRRILEYVQEVSEKEGRRPSSPQKKIFASVNSTLLAIWNHVDELTFRFRDFVDGRRVVFQSRLENWWDYTMARVRSWTFSWIGYGQALLTPPTQPRRN